MYTHATISYKIGEPAMVRRGEINGVSSSQALTYPGQARLSVNGGCLPPRFLPGDRV